MKKLKLALESLSGFFDKIETKVSGARPEKYVPVSFVALSAGAIAAAVTILLVVVLQIFSITQETGAIILYCCLGLGMAATAYFTYVSIGLMPGIGRKIALGAYGLVLYTLAFVVTFKLVVLVITAVVLVGGAWLFLKFYFKVFRPGSRIVDVEVNGVRKKMRENTGMLGDSTYENV